MKNNTKSIKVLIVDDSAVVRQVMSAVLLQEDGIEVSVAHDPFFAMDKIKRRRPDVIVLDLEMPRMDGLTYLKKIMSEDPIPVVVCSGQVERGTQNALRALEIGAVDVISRPKVAVREFLHESAVRLIDAVKAASSARIHKRTCSTATAPGPTPDFAFARRPRDAGDRNAVVVIGASTGGTEALRELLEAMPEDCPGIVIVQHMPEVFTAAFAARLNQICCIEVKEAADGDLVKPGRALIAPGNRHLLLRRNGSDYRVEVHQGPLVNRHRPSVDVLFRSAARVVARDAVAVIMTGMGQDGAEGMRELKAAGANTIAQDEATCVVFGMPREAILRGVADLVLPLPEIAGAVLQLARQPRPVTTRAAVV